jgi:hypothetical protein
MARKGIGDGSYESVDLVHFVRGTGGRLSRPDRGRQPRQAVAGRTPVTRKCLIQKTSTEMKVGNANPAGCRRGRERLLFHMFRVFRGWKESNATASASGSFAKVPVPGCFDRFCIAGRL